MEGRISTSTGITVHRQIVVRSNGISHDRTKSGTPSVISVIQALSDVRPKTPESYQEGTSGEMRDDLGHHLAREEGVAGIQHERQRNHETVQHLIEFLKTTPPKGNRMSTPDNYSKSSLPAEGNRWKRKFNELRSKGRKLKKRHKGPPVIRLPDTAVAATTIEGHRHISISIPLEHSYMGPTKLAHYNTSDLTQELQSRLGGNTPSELGRTYSTEKPVGSVLKTVAEDGESIVSEPLTATPRSSENPERSTSLRAPPTRTLSVTSMTDEGLPSSLRGTTRVGTPPGEEEEDEDEDMEDEDGTIKIEFPRPPTRGIEAQAARKAGPQPVVVLPTMKPTSPERRNRQEESESPVESTRGEPSSTPHVWNTSTVPTITFTLPTRKSSKRITSPASLPLEGAYSIDNVLSPSPIQSPYTSDESSGSGMGSTSSNSQDHTFGFGLGRFARGSVAESVMTTGSEPRVLNAQAAKAYRTQVPIVVRPPSIHSVEVVHADDEDAGSEDTSGEDPPPTFGDLNETRDDEEHHDYESPPRRPQLARSLTTHCISRAAQTDISAHASIQRILDRQQYLHRSKTDASRPSPPPFFSAKDRTVTPPGIHQLPAGTVHVWPEYGVRDGLPSPPHSEKPPSTVRYVGAISSSSQAVPLSPISPSPNTRRRLLLDRPSNRSTLSGGHTGGLQTPSLENLESTASASSSSSSSSSSSVSLSDDMMHANAAAAAALDLSYYRRLERRAERDAHKARRVRHSFEALARESREAARLLQREMAAAATDPSSMPSRAELLRRHDQLREHRLRDMERRLRRLERNGDVWLRSVVPLLGSLHRLLEEHHRYDAATTTAVGGASLPSVSSLPSLVPFPGDPVTTGPSKRRSSSLRGHKRVSDQSLGSRSKSLHYPRHRHSRFEHLDDSHSHKERQSAPNPGELDRDRAGTVRPWWKAEAPAEYPGNGTGGVGSGSDYFNFRDRLKRSLGGGKRSSGKDDNRQTADEKPSLEKLEPLMRELQGAARFTIGGVGGAKGEYHVPGMWEESLPEMTSTDESERETVPRGKKQTMGKEGEKDYNKGQEVSALH